MKKNFCHFGISKYSCGETYPRRAGHRKRKKFTDYRDRWQVTWLWGTGCYWCLWWRKRRTRGNGLPEKKKGNQCVRTCVCMLMCILVVESRGDKTNKTKLWSSGSNVSMVTEIKPSGRICIPPINKTMLVSHQKWTKMMEKSIRCLFGSLFLPWRSISFLVLLAKPHPCDRDKSWWILFG